MKDNNTLNQLSSITNKLNIMLNTFAPQHKIESNTPEDICIAIEALDSNCKKAIDVIDVILSGEYTNDLESDNGLLLNKIGEIENKLMQLYGIVARISNGDYYVDTDSLGNLGNLMTLLQSNIREREKIIIDQANMMERSAESLKSLLGAVKDWIIVTNASTGDTVYANESAKGFFYNPETNTHVCGDGCDLIDYLKTYGRDITDAYVMYNYSCKRNIRHLVVTSYLISWDDLPAYAHYIEDITDQIEYRERIEEMAFTDPLTGLFNRRYCLNKMEEMMKNKIPFAFTLIDLDGLKFANDTFGHLAGDEYLTAVSSEMKSSTRSTDILCRIGGDEFVIIFPKCPNDIAIKKMSIMDQLLQSKSKEYPMSMSYGVVSVYEEATYDAEEIITEADERMYKLKKEKKKDRKK